MGLIEAERNSLLNYPPFGTVSHLYFVPVTGLSLACSPTVHMYVGLIYLCNVILKPYII